MRERQGKEFRRREGGSITTDLSNNSERVGKMLIAGKVKEVLANKKLTESERLKRIRGITEDILKRSK